jgi:hypothetical protein
VCGGGGGAGGLGRKRKKASVVATGAGSEMRLRSQQSLVDHGKEPDLIKSEVKLLTSVKCCWRWWKSGLDIIRSPFRNDPFGQVWRISGERRPLRTYWGLLGR